MNKKKPSAGVVIWIMFLCFLLLIVGSVFSVWMVGKSVISPDSITKTISDMDFSRVKVSGVSGSGQESITEIVQDTFQLPGNAPVELKAVEELMDEKYVKDFIGDTMSEYVNAFVTGDEDAGLEAKDIERFLTKNREKIGKSLDVTISESDIDQIVEQVKDSGVLEDIKPAAIMDQIDGTSDIQDMMNIIKIIFSQTVLYISVAVIAFLVLLVFLNRAYLRTKFLNLGITVLFLGGINYLLYFGVGIVGDLAKEEGGMGAYLINSLLAPVKRQTLNQTAILLIAAAVLIALSFVIRLIKPKSSIA